MMPKKFCAVKGCNKLIHPTESYCDECKAKKSKEYDRQRGTSTERGYGYRWRRYRERFLKENPLCAECLKSNQLTSATVVDHIVPHKGNMVLFWDPKNHQSLCKHCHDVKTAKEDGGFGNERRYKV